MRRVALLALSAMLLAFVPPKRERRVRQVTARLVDKGQIYSTINTIDCLGWPNEEVKKAAGSYAWGSWYPNDGDVGVAVSRSVHCFQPDVTVVILRIDDHHVPVGTRGITFETGSVEDVPSFAKP